MSWQGIVIAVENPKIRFMLIDTLNTLGIQFSMCELGDAICEVALVIFSDHFQNGPLASRIIPVRDDSDIERALIVALVKTHDIVSPLSVVVGIDPGLRFGIALVVNGILIHSLTTISPGEAADVTVRWSSIMQHRFAPRNLVIRVGSGSKFFATLFLRALQHRSQMSNVELVDEHHTTLTSGFQNDQSSAALIALRQGVPFDNSSLILERKVGHLRLLKRLFGRLTGGVSLSTEDANRILSGAVSLDELVEHYAPKKD